MTTVTETATTYTCDPCGAATTDPLTLEPVTLCRSCAHLLPFVPEFPEGALLLVALENGMGDVLHEPATVARVNRVLRLAGRDERLTAGRGYYYWRGGNSARWHSVYVYRASDLTLRGFLLEAASNAQEFDRE